MSSKGIIQTDDELLEQEIKPDQDSFFGTKSFAILPNYERSIPAREELIYNSENAVSYFLTQINFGSYVVNNVTLCFYKDTLSQINYTSNIKLVDILADKYEGKATDKKTSHTTSLCKLKKENGIPYQNNYIEYYLKDRSINTTSKVSIINLLNEDCNYTNWVRVEIFSTSKINLRLMEGIKYRDYKKSKSNF